MNILLADTRKKTKQPEVESENSILRAFDEGCYVAKISDVSEIRNRARLNRLHMSSHYFYSSLTT
jgi:hypothetical protein